jgi:hypothetical protein
MNGPLRRDLLHHATHRVARPNDFVFAQPPAELAVFILQPAQPQNVFNCQQELFGRKRLFEKIHRAQARGAHGHLDVRLAGHHDDRRCDFECFQIFEQGQAVFSRHDDVGEDHVEPLRFEQLERARGAVGHRDLVARQAKCPRK